MSLNENSKYRLMNPIIIKALMKLKIICPFNFLMLNKKKLIKSKKLPKNCSTTKVVFTCSPIIICNETCLVKNNKIKPIVKNRKA